MFVPQRSILLRRITGVTLATVVASFAALLLPAAAMSQSVLPAGLDVDAEHLLDDGRVVFSLDKKADLDGERREPGDVLIYEPTTGGFELLLSHDQLDGKGKADVDAVFMQDDRTLLFSTVKDGRLAGADFGPGDVVAFDLADGSASVVVPASAFGESGKKPKLNIDSLELLEDGSLVFSSSAKVTLSGLDLDRGEVARFDPATGLVEYYVPAAPQSSPPTPSTLGVSGSLVPPATSSSPASGQDALATVPVLPHPAALAFALLAAGVRRIER